MNWQFLTQLFKKRPLKRAAVADVLHQQSKLEVLEHARKLYSQGVWVRELEPGEVPTEVPEIAEEPYK